MAVPHVYKTTVVRQVIETIWPTQQVALGLRAPEPARTPPKVVLTINGLQVVNDYFSSRTQAGEDFNMKIDGVLLLTAPMEGIKAANLKPSLSLPRENLSDPNRPIPRIPWYYNPMDVIDHIDLDSILILIRDQTYLRDREQVLDKAIVVLLVLINGRYFKLEVISIFHRFYC